MQNKGFRCSLHICITCHAANPASVSASKGIVSHVQLCSCSTQFIDTDIFKWSLLDLFLASTVTTLSSINPWSSGVVLNVEFHVRFNLKKLSAILVRRSKCFVFCDHCVCACEMLCHSETYVRFWCIVLIYVLKWKLFSWILCSV